MSKKILNASSTENKKFTYELEGVSFTFDLRVDIKKELVAAKELLARAIADFDAELKERF